MKGQEQALELKEMTEPRTAECAGARSQFSAYLDGALDGRSMGELADHLRGCAECDNEFEAWRTIQAMLAEMGQAPAPRALQSQLRDALAGELHQENFLSPWQRLGVAWQRTLAPLGLRLGAGLAGAMFLLTGLSWVVGTAAPVQANDERMADLVAPRYLYSVMPPDPVTTGGHFVAVMVDAKVDVRGRVYDYDLIQGPDDAATRQRVEANLIESIFRPATLFGVAVPGHAMVTYTTVSVRG